MMSKCYNLHRTGSSELRMHDDIPNCSRHSFSLYNKLYAIINNTQPVIQVNLCQLASCQVRRWDWIRHWLSASSVFHTIPGGVNHRTVCTHVGVWSIVSWRTWLALFPHVMTGRHMVAGHVVLWAARAWSSIKTRQVHVSPVLPVAVVGRPREVQMRRASVSLATY